MNKAQLVEARLEYPHLEKRRNMLRLLSNALDEARRVHGDHLLRLYFERGSMLTGEAQLLVYRTEQDVAGDLNLSGAEAVGLLNELGGDGYLHLDYGKHSPNASWGLVNVRFQEKGRSAIEELPSSAEEPAIPATQEELASIKARLQQQGFGTALNHLNQAESAFNRREWESANAQIRSCLEAVFDGVAGARLHTTETGGAARKKLAEKGLLPKYEARLVQHFMDVAGGAGSHAGRSNEDEARGRFLAGLGICYIGLSLMPRS